MADPKKPRPAFAPWDRRELPGAFTVEETARRVGNYKWVEMRLAELREMNPDRVTVPANDGIVAFMDAMTEPEAPEHTIEKLVGVYRVLIPHKIAAYTYHLNNTSTITDAPTIRSLKLALNDEFDDWRDGEMLVQYLIETPEEVDRAAAHQAKLEKLMLAAGGIAGPGTLGATQDAEVHA